VEDARLDHTATLLTDGRVLVVGGNGGVFGATSGALSSALVFDSSAGSWTAVPNLGDARGGHQAILLPDGRVLVAGGLAANDALASAELFDPTSGSWSGAGNPIGIRGAHTATLLPDGRVLIAGGTNSRDETYATAELFDPRGGS
jgi:hypothetical protein